MKATIAGAACSVDELTAVVAALFGDGREIRIAGGRAWADLGLDVLRTKVDALADKVGALVVFEVDVPLGGRGADLSAGRREVPDVSGEVDLTADAADILEDWISQGSGGGFDEEVAATDLAWALAEDEEPLSEPPSSEEAAGADDGPNERWARRLLLRLLDEGHVELAPGAKIHAADLVEGLAEVLAEGGDELAEAVADHLVDVDAFAEIYVGPDEIDPLLDATRG